METENTHIHKFEQIEVASTCKEHGYTLYRCECGYEHKGDFKPLENHIFDVVDEKSPTCTENGIRKFQCSKCGEEKVEVISPTGHAWGEWKVEKVPTCVEKGIRYSQCSKCGEVKKQELLPIGHEWGNWQVHKFATCTEEGEEIRICKRCQEAEKRVIKAKGHDWSLIQKSKTEKGMVEYFCKNCGEKIVKPSMGRKIRRIFIRVFLLAFVLGAITIAGMRYGIPALHYYSAKKLMKNGAYKEAYLQLCQCRNFKDSKKLLEDFQVEFEEVLVTYKSNYYGEVKKSKNRIENTYDENGNLLTKNEYDEDGELDSRTVYEYDADGREISEIEYDAEDKKETEYLREFHENGEQKSYVCRMYGDWGYESVNEYNEDGELIYETRRNSDGDFEYQINYEYGKNGSKVTKSSYDDDGEYESKEVKEYNKNQECLSVVLYDKNDDIVLQYKNKFDKKGNIIVEYDEDEEELKKYTYEYQYDKDGNVTSKIKFSDNDEQIVSKYEYDYDEEGNKTKTTYCSYDEENGKLSGKGVTKYNKQLDVVWTAEYDADGNLESRMESGFWGSVDYYYDEEGELEEREIYFGRDRWVSKLSFRAILSYEEGEIVRSSMSREDEHGFVECFMEKGKYEGEEWYSITTYERKKMVVFYHPSKE